MTDSWPVTEHGGWLKYDSEASGLCNLSRAPIEAFERIKDEPHIVELTLKFRNAAIKGLSTRHSLIRKYGDYRITLASSNTKSYRKKGSTLKEYIADMLKQRAGQQIQRPARRANETWYWFGDIDHQQWADLLGKYKLPREQLNTQSATLTYGIGGQFSGVPLHTHGAVFAETLYGRKRWFIMHPDVRPDFDGEIDTSYSWSLRQPGELRSRVCAPHPLADVLHDDTAAALDVCRVSAPAPSALPNEEKMARPVYVCTLAEGELLYVPAMWWHATLNLDETVFVSAFV
ncbi:JmjC domain-containing protein 8 [Porphyridium purpureum]|uniref:JmjC domain-containing protein 8 n=1 Tax=Porphyridium purpureum TaxID=35688 RepID=A0A5J4YY74_PORPP|nr:JmjC domain-containing protein 8 [Porphyridium purpureum]|eukprot:POR5349..scf209_3